MASNWNRLMDGLAKTPLTAREGRVVAAIARKTLGWNKPCGDRISGYQLAQETGLPRRHVAETLARLEDRNVIVREGGSRGRAASLAINLDFKSWRALAPKPVPATGTKTGTSRKRRVAPQPVPELAPTPVHTRGKGLNQNTLVTRTAAAYLNAGGSLELDAWRAALARQTKLLDDKGVDHAVIRAAAASLGRANTFPGYLTQRATELTDNGGACHWQGLNRSQLTPTQLAECPCHRCATYANAHNTKVPA